MAKALTTKGIEALKKPATRTEIPDAGLSGLYLVVQPTGSKTWALRARIGGKPVKLTLGKWPVMGLADARTAAATALERIERGEDPVAEKKAAKAAQEAAETKAEPEPDRDTVKAVIELFEKRHLKHIRSADQVMEFFRREVLEPWGARPIQSITMRDVIDLLDGIVDRGSPVTANRLRAHLNTLFRWAVGRDVLERNPLDGIRPPAPEKSRDRVLTGEEIALFWNAAGTLGHPFAPAFRLLLLTGQRLREVCEMTWRELEGEVWTLPAARSKNGDPHVVPLSPEAQAILEDLPKITGCPFVFSTTGETPVSGFTRAKSRLDAAMAKAANEGRPQDAEPVKIPDFTLHDLRRTAATGMAGLRFPPHVVEAVLNHRSGTRRGVASVYNRHDHLEEKREALTAWARYVRELVDGPASNVVPLAAKGGR